jgi:hypothetical protein
MLKTKKKAKSGALTKAQTQSARKFEKYSSDNPKLTFAQVSLQELGRNPFLKTSNGREFRRECLRGFNRERAS